MRANETLSQTFNQLVHLYLYVMSSGSAAQPFISRPTKSITIPDKNTRAALRLNPNKLGVRKVRAAVSGTKRSCSVLPLSS